MRRSSSFRTQCHCQGEWHPSSRQPGHIRPSRTPILPGQQEDYGMDPGLGRGIPAISGEAPGWLLRGFDNTTRGVPVPSPRFSVWCGCLSVGFQPMWRRSGVPSSTCPFLHCWALRGRFHRPGRWRHSPKQLRLLHLHVPSVGTSDEGTEGSAPR